MDGAPTDGAATTGSAETAKNEPLESEAVENEPPEGDWLDDSPLPFAAPTAEELPVLLEALLFVAEGPVAEPALARALGAPPRRLRDGLDALAQSLAERGIRLQRGPDGVQLITAPHAAAVVEHFLGIESGRRLSNAALETLAIIAYRQPVTRAAIEAIRGSSSDAVLATLRARDLIERVGHADGPGRPSLYATTQRFLEHFGLEQPEDLPGLDELGAILDARAAEDAPGTLGLDGDENGNANGEANAEHTVPLVAAATTAPAARPRRDPPPSGPAARAPMLPPMGGGLPPGGSAAPPRSGPPAF
jgi:segregation and condensation protein B